MGYLFTRGCSGNVNSFALKGGIDAATAARRDLGETVGRAEGQLQGSIGRLGIPISNTNGRAHCVGFW